MANELRPDKMPRAASNPGAGGSGRWVWELVVLVPGDKIWGNKPWCLASVERRPERTERSDGMQVSVTRVPEITKADEWTG